MVSEIHAIQTHLWVLTGLLFLLLLAAGYCNYSRIKERDKPSPEDVMASMFDKNQIQELYQFATSRLKELPNNADALVFQAVALLELDRPDEALAIAERVTQISPRLRDSGKSLIEMARERGA
ncbi:hypothetical protein [Luteimonas vadosa]|uniref:Tetratricopeptide repeat protein n=1 Tax=Luteimonas vadosa TaxID=1165507 RepID=A0ABP9DVK6_9GAMM